jgi:hypothetical protein
MICGLWFASQKSGALTMPNRGYFEKFDSRLRLCLIFQKFFGIFE